MAHTHTQDKIQTSEIK